jgi:hypothetical protein
MSPVGVYWMREDGRTLLGVGGLCGWLAGYAALGCVLCSPPSECPRHHPRPLLAAGLPSAIDARSHAMCRSRPSTNNFGRHEHRTINSHHPYHHTTMAKRSAPSPPPASKESNTMKTLLSWSALLGLFLAFCQYMNSINVSPAPVPAVSFPPNQI